MLQRSRAIRLSFCALAANLAVASASAQLYEFTFHGTVTDNARNITAGNPLENLTPGMTTTYKFTIDSSVTPSVEDSTGRLWFDPDIYAAMSFSSSPISFSRTGDDVQGGFGILDNATSNYPGQYQDAFDIAMLVPGAPIDFFTFQLHLVSDTPGDFIDGLDIPSSVDVGNTTLAQYGVTSGSAFRLIQINNILIREVPTPGTAAVLALGGLVAVRRRR